MLTPEQDNTLNSLVANRDYSGARRMLTEIAHSCQSDAHYWRFLAHVERKLGNLPEAERLCVIGLGHAPGCSILEFEVGLIFQEAGRYKEAIELLKWSIANADNQSGACAFSHEHILATAHNSLGLTYKLAGDCTKAVANYEKATEIVGEEVYQDLIAKPERDYRILSEALQPIFALDLALKTALRHAVNDDAKKIAWPNGETALKMVNDEKGHGMIFKDLPDGTRFLGVSYIEAFLEALTLRPLFATTLGNIASAYAATGDQKRADEYMREALRFRPGGPSGPSEYRRVGVTYK